MTPYRTLFVGTLCQDSALAVGGTDGDAGVIDKPLARDGAGRFTLRGTGLAGALIATARRLGVPIPPGITGKPGEDRGDYSPSLWRFHHSHPQGSVQPELRQNVSLRPETGAADPGLLFSSEMLPRGTRWPFLMEVETGHPGGFEAEWLAAHALKEWACGACWIGRDVARGAGWMRLEELCAYRLDRSHARKWPDSTRPPAVTLKDLKAKDALPASIPVAEFGERFDPLPSGRAPWHYLEVEGMITAGPASNGYGLDPLSIGGHATAGPGSEVEANRLVSWSLRDPTRMPALQSGHVPVMTAGSAGIEPFIPGSSLRGPLRHTVIRLLNAHKRKPDGVKRIDSRIFGTVSRSSQLLVRDAHLVDIGGKPSWQAALLEHHAGDEFSGGVFGSGKFDRIVLVSGTFAWRMVAEVPTEADALFLEKLVEYPLNLATASHLPLGGAKWRGAGWPAWSVSKRRIRAAGKD